MDVSENRPSDWSVVRRMEYLDWAEKGYLIYCIVLKRSLEMAQCEPPANPDK